MLGWCLNHDFLGNCEHFRQRTLRRWSKNVFSSKKLALRFAKRNFFKNRFISAFVCYKSISSSQEHFTVFSTFLKTRHAFDRKRGLRRIRFLENVTIVCCFSTESAWTRGSKKSLFSDKVVHNVRLRPDPLSESCFEDSALLSENVWICWISHWI